MKNLLTYLILLILAAVTGCGVTESEDEELIAEETNFILELPDTTKTHSPNIFYEVKKKLVDELNLDRLENGVDSFELRLWTKVEVTNGGQVFVIKKVDDKWQCQKYSYIETERNWINGRDMYENLLDFSIDTFWVDQKTPKSNWVSFLNSLNKEGIYELPSQEEIIGWENSVTDGFTFYVEYATNQKYKFYVYNCPDYYEQQFKESKHMSNILDLFDKEIGLNMTLGYKCIR